jgi:hypothetical protein
MSVADPLAAFPDRVPAGKDRPGVDYVRLPDHVAVHSPQADDLGGAEFVLRNAGIGVFRQARRPRNLGAGAELTPVYALPSGPPSVPTGSIFVRLREGMPFESRRADFERVGYRIVRTVSYAPHAGWLAGTSIARSLGDLPRLLDLDDVVNVEPEMLTPAARKSSAAR